MYSPSPFNAVEAYDLDRVGVEGVIGVWEKPLVWSRSWVSRGLLLRLGYAKKRSGFGRSTSDWMLLNTTKGLLQDLDYDIVLVVILLSKRYWERVA